MTIRESKLIEGAARMTTGERTEWPRKNLGTRKRRFCVNRYEEAAGRLASEFALDWRAVRPRKNRDGPGRIYGQAWRGTLRFEAPRPNTPRNLLLWLHEAAHVLGPFFGDDYLAAYAAEVKAYAWAFLTYRKILGERAPGRLRRWAKRQLEGQHWLAIDAAFALVE